MEQLRGPCHILLGESQRGLYELSLNLLKRQSAGREFNLNLAIFVYPKTDLFPILPAAASIDDEIFGAR